MKNSFSIKGNYVDLIKREIFPAEVFVMKGIIDRVIRLNEPFDVFLMPGFVDAHVHIESSMLIPQEFARLAVRHGTVATVSDPHEIANVMGVEGIDFMLHDAEKVPLKFHFGAPSCVPATAFETSGFELGVKDVEELLGGGNMVCLSEMMNFPGVVYDNPKVYGKLEAAKKASLPIDGHAPGLKGDDLKKYAEAGITTDHESVSAQEAIEKIKLGIKLQIREGSAAKNFEALWPVLNQYPESVMFCTDDCHPDDLLVKHINDQVKRAVDKGIDLFDVLCAANYNTIKHYNLSVGLLQVGDPADFIVVDDLKKFTIIETYIEGVKVYSKGKVLFKSKPIIPVNNFHAEKINVSDIELNIAKNTLKVMVAKDGDLYTECKKEIVNPVNGKVYSDTERDLLKIVLLNRYKKEKPVIALIKNIGLNRGAIAESVAHDSHNIIAVGVNDEDIVAAINAVVNQKGGMAAVCGQEQYVLPLPIAGLMSDEPGDIVAAHYELMNRKAKEWGSPLRAPFMTLSFMALLVIPELKIGDKGLFDGKKFELTSIEA